MPEMNMRTFTQRFWSYIDRSGGKKLCWPWLRARSTKGYGRAWFRGRVTQAHRVAYALTRNAGRSVPKRFLVCHHCDSRLCCNPAHLFRGTCHDNTQDMLAKRRNSNGDCTKLNTKQVEKIRSSYAAGQRVDALAVTYGVATSTIYDLLKGRTWKHI